MHDTGGGRPVEPFRGKAKLGLADRDIAGDVVALCAALPTPPLVIGASMGGAAALFAQALSDRQLFRGLVLVDITPDVDMEGGRRIIAFMTDNPDGYATLDDAADAQERDALDLGRRGGDHRAREPEARGLREPPRRLPGLSEFAPEPDLADGHEVVGYRASESRAGHRERDPEVGSIVRDRSDAAAAAVRTAATAVPSAGRAGCCFVAVGFAWRRRAMASLMGATPHVCPRPPCGRSGVLVYTALPTH